MLRRYMGLWMIVAALVAPLLAWILRCPCGPGCACDVLCRCPRFWSPALELLSSVLAVLAVLLIARRRPA